MLHICVCVCERSTQELYGIWLTLLPSDLRWVDGAGENLITSLVRMEGVDVLMECVWVCVHMADSLTPLSQVNQREQERLVDLRHL